MNALKSVLLAILVVGGWLAALLWLSFSVVQIAVEHSTTMTVKAHCLPSEEVPCSH